jgi:hypothetical protein
MATHGTLSIWLADIGRRARAGETRISLAEVEASTGCRVEPRINAYSLWGNLWSYLEHSGLVKCVHSSIQEDEDSCVDMRLTLKGSDAKAWII